ncbi:MULTISPECIES: RNA polymerase sigma factor [Anaerolinea]|uniref:RNA polymerase ECF-type sigma factor n=1 Tax=Anaerolinea thermophila (strain DSM 14523 / JCM 11388 / NBRC 100420 / UNI-1) TaxID=926569 RepID=E8MZV5_ANATU|nr:MULTISPECIES: sigma-70 family RNA polymerase sigma factor [Anaerolinea]BAJ62290.1 RNA polymerase ECF-type sigma factor [Anaerolinea thermophila UNI-1]
MQELELTQSAQAQALTLDWESVYTELLPRVYNYFRYRGLEDEVAEDLTAQTFEKAWRKRASYRHDLAAFSTWVLRIAHNVAMDYHRTHGRQVSLEEMEVHGGEAHPEESMMARDEILRLRRLLAQLPPREQELVALKYGSGLTNRTIAQMTGLSESNVGTILHRVVQMLRAQLKGEE